MVTTKLDLVKEYKTYYTAKPNPELVEFNEIPFLTNLFLGFLWVKYSYFPREIMIGPSRNLISVS